AVMDEPVRRCDEGSAHPHGPSTPFGAAWLILGYWSLVRPVKWGITPSANLLNWSLNTSRGMPMTDPRLTRWRPGYCSSTPRKWSTISAQGGHIAMSCWRQQPPVWAVRHPDGGAAQPPPPSAQG